ncbi:MAG: hypothetical protein KF830_09885 [Planctomycetes bacterium]|nr:hypothetical protein [Planctomycetota bacterium]
MAGPRQRIGGRLLLVTNLAVANLAAGAYVVLFAQPGVLAGADPTPLAALFGGSRVALVPLGTALAWVCLLLAAALLVGNFAWLVRRSDRALPADWIVSDTPAGPVRIAREALETGLQRAGEALPEITRLRVAVDTGAPKRILVRAWFQCAEGTSNLAASQRLRQAIGERFGSMVRPADGVRVETELEFQGFAGKLGRRGAEVPPAEEAPFTGPRYPIDDEASGGNA